MWSILDTLKLSMITTQLLFFYTVHEKTCPCESEY